MNTNATKGCEHCASIIVFYFFSQRKQKSHSFMNVKRYMISGIVVTVIVVIIIIIAIFIIIFNFVIIIGSKLLYSCSNPQLQFLLF